jgi:Spy/CpxP family protein refolding chaperone
MKIKIVSWPKAVSAILATGFLGTLLLTAQTADPGTGRPTRTNRGGFQGAQPGGPGGGQGGGGMRGGWLDDQHQALLRESRQKHDEESNKLDEQMRVAQRELMKAVLAEKPDEKVVREKAEAVAKIQVEQTVLRAKIFAPVVATLKPEQRDQLENSPMGMMMLGGMGGRGGFGGRGGPGGGPQGQPR